MRRGRVLRNLSRPRADRAGPGRGRAGVGGCVAPARRTQGLRWSPGSSWSRHVRDRRRRAALRGVEAALTRALASVGSALDPRAGAGARRFVALAAASVARPGQAVIVEGKEEQGFLEPLLLPPPSRRTCTPSSKGCGYVGSASWRPPPGGAVEERLGAWRGSGLGALLQAGNRAPNLIPACVGDRLRRAGGGPLLPRGVGESSCTLARVFGALLDRLLVGSERAGRPLR